MNKQIFYTYKFKSSRLKEFNYNIENLTFKQAQENKEVISMFDSQLFRSIRHLKNKNIDYEFLEGIKSKLEHLKRQTQSKENLKEIEKSTNKINTYLFVPEIVSVVIENKGHYNYIFKHGINVNGKTFRRFSCSAGQARNSIVILCESETADKLDEIFDNGRDTGKELVPSKFNAYKGLVTSSTSVVSTPRFCLVPDYKSETNVKVNFVTETGINEDDVIEVKEITELFNRFDGQGLISVEMATKWANELGLDYVPSQWCIRQNYIKGMLSTFDIFDFCKEKNNGNYMVKTSYLDENGKPRYIDLRSIDVVISESQFKLWDSFSSMEEYQDNCKKNNLQWGVSLVSPKKDKDILKMNYQFIQTLRLNQQDIEKICEKFVDWISGVTSKDIYYTLLFLIGTEIDEDRIMDYLNKSENHWVKALLLNNKLINDKWMKKKIYDLMKKKIKNGCMGQIFIDGNFQVLVSDPFAQMQHICELPVTGLLGRNEYYSNYWNNKGVKTVDSMRAPLTYRSEHVLLNLKKNNELDHWYKYNTTGIIVNVHGHETMNWAGSDFDMDIIATTSDETIIKGVYKDELPVTYTPPKSSPSKLTDRKLYNADLHSFGSEIGQITNKSTSAYALLSELNEGSKEYETTMNRIKMCTKLQSAQIDKAKIGRKVKSIPKIWLEYNKTNEADSEQVAEQKEFLNSILLDKHPYFFTYLYKNTKRKYKNFYKNQDVTCKQKFGISLQELKNLQRKTKEQIKFLNEFKEKSPVIDSDCVMNKLCRYIESIDFGIRNIINENTDEDYFKYLMFNENFELDKDKYNKIKKVYKDYKNTVSLMAATNSNDISYRNGHDEEIQANVLIGYDLLEQSLSGICSDIYELVDYLIYMFYVDKNGANKEVLWTVYGQYIYENIRSKVDKTIIPVPDENGGIKYLNNNYSLKEVVL